MFVVTELTRLVPISGYYVPTLEPFVVAYKFYYGVANADIATWWSGAPFSVTEATTEKTFVTGVVYNVNINYSKKDTLVDCLADEQSFFWDNTAQVLYIHYNLNHKIDRFTFNFDYGVAIGTTNDQVRHFDNRTYRPFLKSFPEIEVGVDKFNYDELHTIVSEITFDNNTGFFNQFKDTPIYGNGVSIKTGEEGDLYVDLIERAAYFVDDYDFSASDFVVTIQDVRKTATVPVPNNILNTTDYPDLGETSIGKTIPFGYSPSGGGWLHDVPGLCVNGVAIDSGTSPDFIFLEVLYGSALSDIEVYIKNADDVWVLQASGVSVNWTTGVVTIDGAKTVTGSDYGAFPVRANVRGVQNTYASDIIKDMNLRFLGYTYDDSNYARTEWEEEESYLAPIALYMKSTKDLFQWIKEIQSLSTAGFRYTNTPANKFVIRVDNPNKDVVVEVPAIHIKDIAEVVAQSNKDDVYNKVYIGYNKSIAEDTAPRVEDETYFDISFAEYKIERIYNKISGLETLVEATYKASIQAEDYYKIRQVFDLILIGEQYLELQLYDIITANITLVKKVFTETPSGITTEEVGDSYFGIIRGQVTGIKPDYNLKTNNIQLRARPESDVWTDIYHTSASASSISSASGDATLEAIPTNIIAFSTDAGDIDSWLKMDGAEASPTLIGKYPKVHASEGSIGGAVDHSHATFSGNLGNSPVAVFWLGETTSGAKEHLHAMTHTHAVDENNEPEYLEALPVTDGSELKTTMFLFYDGASPPTDWSVYAAAYDKFIKGAATPGGTGGNANHQHSHSGDSSETNPPEQADSRSSQSDSHAPLLNLHAHVIDHTHTLGQNEPLWHGLLPVVPDSNTDIIPSGICAFFKGSVVPYGWSYFSTAAGKWIKGKSTGTGTGGADTHNHVLSGEDSGYFAGVHTTAFLGGITPIALADASGHKHDIDHTHDTVDNVPPYQELLFCKKD